MSDETTGRGDFAPHWLDGVRATKSDNGVLIRMSHDNARKLAALVGELPPYSISVDLYEALRELGFGVPE